MATMTLSERLKVAEAAGVKAGRYGPLDAPCPYSGPEHHSEHEIWLEGREAGRQQRVHDERIAQNRLKAEGRRVAFEDKLMELFGDQEMRDEFEQWLADFIDARTR